MNSVTMEMEAAWGGSIGDSKHGRIGLLWWKTLGWHSSSWWVWKSTSAFSFIIIIIIIMVTLKGGTKS